MMVEKVPDSTYEMVGGLDKQIKEIKEVIELPVKHPELFDALGISQPKVCYSFLLFYYVVFDFRVFFFMDHRVRVKLF
jgi:ATP-dependent 26S proteasome regulatory subunit